MLRVGNLDAERDLADVRDVAAAYATLAAHGERATAYNVCTGRAYRIGDLLEMLLTRARVPIRVEVDPERVRAIERPRLLGDNSRLRTLGWSPQVPIETTIQDVLDYWRAEPA